jgi:hypothetical protein
VKALQLKPNANAISEAASQVFSRDELKALTDQQCASFETLLVQRMQKQPAPTLQELQGIKELVLEHLSHPALGSLSKALPSSTDSDKQST